MKIPSKNSEVLVGIDGLEKKLVALKDWALNCERGTIDASTLSTEWKEFFPGQISATGSLSLLYDPTNTEAEKAIESAMFDGNRINILFRPEGSAIGKKQYALEAYITTWNLTAATEDMIQVAVSFAGAGPIKDEVQA